MDNLFAKWWGMVIFMLLSSRVAALIIFALTLGGCSPAAPAKFPEGVIRLDTGMIIARAQEFRLSDDTRCVALLNHHGTAITCEWQPDIVLKQ